MSKGLSHIARKTFRLRKEMSIGFYLTDFFFRKILRQNSHVTWAIHHSCTIHCPEKIKRGKNVYPGDSPGVYINAQSGISIGDYTIIGPNTGLISANHDPIDNERHLPSSPMVIGAHCWIGMGAIILPGVTLGDFTIVGAGTIVTKNFPEGYCVVAGSPARIIKYLNKNECEAFAKSK